jgi:preprotein translocase subunit SecA
LRLLVDVFVLWTFSQITEEFENDEDQIDFKKEPHVTQVLSLLVLFDMHVSAAAQQSNTLLIKLSNRLIQIKTGQGKSIILGIASTIFALLGYHVDVVCYSAYLSERDFAGFLQIFNSCLVTEKVRYGTFLQLSSDIIKK